MMARPGDQRRVLAGAFLARFFENEISAGSGDLRNSFFWLIAFLAAPGFLAPVAMIWSWNFVGLIYGADALRIASRADKVLYLGFTTVATGILAAIIWNALLIDRRDARVLGVLPVRPATVVRAKLRALVTYTAIVAIAMHTLSALTFGTLLATGRGGSFALRGILAHFLAASMASGFILLAIAALQGTAVALLGPRRFARASPLFQLGLVAALLLSVLSITTISLSINDTLAGEGPRLARWILWTPPVWFLGVYEWLLGTEDPALRALALAGVTSLATGVIGCWASFPPAYRRVMVAAIETSEGGRPGRASFAARFLTTVLSRAPAARASTQFLLSTLGRSERHRFAIATTLGLAFAFSLPVLLQFRRTVDALPDQPPVPMLVLPVAIMLLVLVGLRVSVALPSDLPATWIFAATPVSPGLSRSGLRRAMFALCVLPAAGLLVPVYGALWGWALAGTHAMLCVAVGAAVVEGLLFGFSGMPCSRPWRPERARLRALWPAYILAFAVITQGVAAASVRLAEHPVWLAAVVMALGGIGLGLRRAGTPNRAQPDGDDDAPKLQVLGID